MKVAVQITFNDHHCFLMVNIQKSLYTLRMKSVEQKLIARLEVGVQTWLMLTQFLLIAIFIFNLLVIVLSYLHMVLVHHLAFLKLIFLHIVVKTKQESST